MLKKQPSGLRNAFVTVGRQGGIASTLEVKWMRHCLAALGQAVPIASPTFMEPN